jgi:hypothetical protein
MIRLSLFTATIGAFLAVALPAVAQDAPANPTCSSLLTWCQSHCRSMNQDAPGKCLGYCQSSQKSCLKTGTFVAVDKTFENVEKR